MPESNLLYVIENDDTRPQYNLALEEYLCRLAVRERKNFFMLWRNEPSVIVGRFQDTRVEVNESFVHDHDIHVVRRNSGGGAVYHDIGNVNYSFIVNDISTNVPHCLNPFVFNVPDITETFATFTRPILNALLALHLSVPIEMHGRNDIVIKLETDRTHYAHSEYKKISGGAEWHHDGVILHHGTLLFDCDLDVLDLALNVSPEKLRRNEEHDDNDQDHVHDDHYSGDHDCVVRPRAVPSVRSRVANIRPLLCADKINMTVESFMEFLLTQLSNLYNHEKYALTNGDKYEVRRLMREKYSRPSWNWNTKEQCHDDRFKKIGEHYDIAQDSDHDHNTVKIVKVKRRFWWGLIECKMQVRDDHEHHNNVITSCKFSGDYFSYNPDNLDGRENYNNLCGRFVGLSIDELTPTRLREVLADIDIGTLFAGAELEDLVTLFTNGSAS